MALRTTCIKKCQIQDYHNKNWLSVRGILSLQLKPKLGRTKPSTGPHAARGLDMGGLGVWKFLLDQKTVHCFGYTANRALQVPSIMSCVSLRPRAMRPVLSFGMKNICGFVFVIMNFDFFLHSFSHSSSC